MDIPIMINNEKEKKRKKFWNEFFKKFMYRSIEVPESADDPKMKQNKTLSSTGLGNKKKVSNVQKSRSNSLSKKTTNSMIHSKPVAEVSTFGRSLFKNPKYTNITSTNKNNGSQNLTSKKPSKVVLNQSNSSNSSQTKKKLVGSPVTKKVGRPPGALSKTIVDGHNRLEYLLRQRYQSIISHQVSSYKFWDHAVDKELYKLNESTSWAKIKGLLIEIAKKMQHENKH